MKIILIILLIGILYRLLLTWNGNFLFNMDNARDMVDVREMVVLHKFRLTGPTAAIEGLFNGPFWYYLLTIPFILSSGDPYGSILTMIVLWAVGGFFLLKLVSDYGKWVVFSVGSIWVTSNYVVLTNLYSFNPNPVILLTPLFIYLLKKYLETGRLFFSIASFFLAGLFFNFEMNFGVFMPVIFVLAILLSDKKKLLKSRSFWLGAGFFILTLLPQAIFDLRHQFIMTNALLHFLQTQTTDGQISSKFLRAPQIAKTFYDSIRPTFMNSSVLTNILIALFFLNLFKYWGTIWKKDLTVLIASLFIAVPFISYIIIPTTVNSWHIGAEMAAFIILTGFILRSNKLISLPVSILIILLAIGNIVNFFQKDFGRQNLDPSLYKNEIAAIDYVYKYANGKNFKVYTYLPSVYDYPYQYLIWWHGLKEFGYLPIDYAYAPNKPKYVGSKTSFSAKESDIKKRENSNLVFLIKEPNHNYTRFGWEGDFIKYNWQPIEKQMIGPIEIEIRKEKLSP